MKFKTIALVSGLVVWTAGILGLQGWIMKKWPIYDEELELKKQQEKEDDE